MKERVVRVLKSPINIKNFLNKVFKRKNNEITIYALELENTVSDNKVISFIDVDNNGAFIRLVHGTSSANARSIIENGLKPISNVKMSVLTYLLSLNSGLDESQIECLLSPEHLDQRRSGTTILLSGRLECDSHGSKLFMLPLYGSEGYLRSACSNALFDGGEIFRVARHILEEHVGQTLQPKFPDAYPVVVIVKCYFEKDFSDGLRISGVEGVQPVIIDSLNSGLFVSGNFEMRLSNTITPSNLEILPLTDYLNMDVRFVSPEAEEWRKRVLTQ